MSDPTPDELVLRLQAVAQRLEAARDRIAQLEADNARLRAAATEAGIRSIEARNPGIENDPTWIAEKELRRG